MFTNDQIANAMKIKLDDVLPEYPEFEQGIRRAPRREADLSDQEIELALKNALRYIPEKFHEQLAPEFYDELMTRGRIYGYRFRPNERIYGKPIDEYEGKIPFNILIIFDINIDEFLNDKEEEDDYE